jgi:hypothetical protein
MEFQNGYRAFIGGGFPSGKGLWDWTDTEEKGVLHWGPAGGGAVVGLFNFNNESFHIETGISFVHLRGEQSLGDSRYEYMQNTIENPVLYKKRLPFPGSDWFLGGGALLMLNPIEARRIETKDGDETEEYCAPGNRLMLGLQLGLDWKFLIRKAHDWMLSLHYTHPLTSPDFSFEKNGSGNIRLNRVDLSVTYLYSPAANFPRRSVR